MNKNYFATGCVLCAIAVGIGAMGAHGLRNVLDPYSLEVYKTAVLYHFLHSIGIIILSFIPALQRGKLIRLAFWLLLGGIILFSGSLYLLSTKSLWTELPLNWLGPLTPLGGLLFIAGWLTAAIGIYQIKRYS
ncbi:MAG: DUF423 domain-containing protein [Bacteroidetes bacterium]|nr:DUF423 domain-containing protein [Bacteroidota bacterium]